MSRSASPLHAATELLLLVVICLWASTYIVTKLIFATLSPLAFTSVRFALMTLLAFAVLAVQARKDSSLWRLDRRDFGRFLASGLTGYTLYQLAFVLGLDRTSAFSSSLIIAMVPLFTLAILAALREPTLRTAWIGVGLAIVGILLFLSDKSNSGGSLLGDAISFGASISFAAYGIVNRPLVKRYATPTYTAYTILAGSVPLLLIGAPFVAAQDWSIVPPQVWLGIAYMVVFPVYVAYQLWNIGIARIGASAASSFSLLTPIVSGIGSALVFGEQFGPLKIAGAALVLLGMLLPRLRAVASRQTPVASR